MPSVAQGRRGSLSAGCLIHPTRIDFTLTPSAPRQEARSTYPLIEDTGLLHSELLRVMDAIDRGVVLLPVLRAALSVVFLAPKASSAEANKMLTAVIPAPYGLRLTDEEDFIFQVNRPYHSRKVEGVKMNSLTKWSVDRLQILSISLPIGGTGTSAQASASTTSQTEQFIAASVHFDINNVPTDALLQQPSSLLREALAAVAVMQQAMGLKIEGFENAELSH
jgi:hypothetical protein